MPPCQEKIHNFRNAVQCMDGWIRELFRDKKINGYDKDIGMYYLGKIALCSNLDANVTNERKKET